MGLFALALVTSTSAHAEPRCQTPSLLEARHRGAARAANPHPPPAGYVDSAIYPIRVHYRQANSRDRALNLVLPAAERAWEVEIDQIGWPAPPPDAGVGGDDRYDLYLTNEGTSGGAYCDGGGPDVTPGDDWYSVPSYIALDERGISDADMPFFVAHELNHAMQYTIDAVEAEFFVWESTAEAIADLVDDANDLYFGEVFDFNALPFASILFDGGSSEITAYGNYYNYEYGGIVFADFLEERYGTKDGTKLLQLWDDLAQPTATQEPDFVDALGLVDPSAPSAAAVYTEFAMWRMFAGSDDDGAHLEEAGDWDDRAIVPTEGDLDLATVDGASLTPNDEPYELGASYWRIALGAGTTQALHAEVTGDAEVQWGLAWAVWPADGSPAVTGTALAAAGAPVAVDLPLEGGATAMIGVVNGGRPDLEGEARNVLRSAFTLDLSLVEPPPDDGTTTDPTTPPDPTTPGDTTTEPDTGGGGDEVPDDGGEPPAEVAAEGGCGCATGGPGSAPSAMLVGLLLAVGRRRATRG